MGNRHGTRFCVYLFLAFRACRGEASLRPYHLQQSFLNLYDNNLMCPSRASAASPSPAPRTAKRARSSVEISD